MLKDKIIEAVRDAAGIDDIDLEFPENEAFGDYSTNVAMQIFRAYEPSKEPKKLFKKAQFAAGNPKRVAEGIVDKLKQRGKLAELVEKIEVAGPGFINFWLKKEVLVDNLIQIDRDKENYGMGDLFKGKKVIFEFTDPNPFKEFHIGHLYTNTIGESLSRIFEASGAIVKRANYQGDVGLHVAKAVWGMLNKMKDESLTLTKLEAKSLTERIKFMGEAYVLGGRAYEEDKTTKDEINSLNKKIFEADPQIKDLYQKGRSWSLDYFETIYKRLGTKFDYYYFESKVGEVGEKIVKENLKKGIFKKSKGAIIFPGSKYGLHDRVFINSLDLPTYEAKELGLAPTKYKDFPYDLSIIITGSEINEYFKVLIKTISLIYPDLGEKTIHIGHGMVRLPEGKMSSRTGKIVTANGLLDEVKSKAAKINKESSEEVCVAAVKYAFLKVGIGKDIIYDINESLSLEGNSGPYLQYTVVRTNSVLAKANDILHMTNKSSVISHKLNDEELSVLRSLSQFSEIISTAAKSYSPNLLCNYLFDLAQKYNNFYNNNRIIDSDNEAFRLKLTTAAGQVLKTGLRLLGIESPERM